MSTKRKKRRPWTFLAILAVLIAAGAWYGGGALGGSGTEQALDGVAVRRGPLRISVIERGNLKAAQSTTLKSEIEGQTTVLTLIEEGVLVKPGDLLCELDVSDLQDKRVEQEIRVQNREAEHIKAQQNFEIQESQNESDIAKGERELEFAQLDLRKYLEGDMPQELQKADEEILLKDEELQRAAQDLDWSEKLAARGFLEQTQLDADRLKKTAAEVALNQAQRAKVLLESYEIPREQRELEAEVEEKQRELERVRLQARARIADYQAELRTSKARFDLEKDEFARLDEQISKAVIRAPVSGMVVYAVESNGRWGGGEPMQEGASVRERQEIITIPSSEGYIAEASLHESVLKKVTTGMPCIVTVDALTDRTFAGAVKFKAVLPDQQSWFANPDLRVYRTEISILDIDPDMRPGMSSSVEILVDDLQDVLQVPVQCVFLDAGDPICFVSDGGKIEKRPVDVGQNNGKLVEVVAGLTEGELVLMSQPAGFSLEPAVERVDGEGDDPWQGRERPVASRAGGETAASKPAAESPSGEGMPAMSAEQAERVRKWTEDNPEAAKRMREAMADPEKRRQMMERFKEGGGAGGGPGGAAARGDGKRKGAGERSGSRPAEGAQDAQDSR